MDERTHKEGKHVRNSIFVSMLISFIVALLFIVQQFFDSEFCPGILPGEWSHFYGIFLYPFFHSDTAHLLSNLPPLFFLVAGTFYYMPRRLFMAMLTIWLISALVIWSFGRSGCHLGASGVIYGLAFMLATLGFLKKQRTLGAFALIIVFMYGSMVWGVLPQDGNVSWEGHAGGALAGVLLAILWRKKSIYTDEPEEEDDDDNTDEPFSRSTHEIADAEINYHFSPKNK